MAPPDAEARAPSDARPILIFLYGGGMAGDCCAANFERAVFRYRPVIELAARFECYKLVHGQQEAVVPGLEVEDTKPAIVLLDGERTLIHKQQRCVDPKKYLDVLREALVLHERRFKMRDAYEARVAEARRRAEAKEYRKALSLVDGLLAKRKELTRSVLAAAEKERSQLVAAGLAALEEARTLRAGDELQAARAAYARVKEQFAAVPEVARPAAMELIEVEAALAKEKAG